MGPFFFKKKHGLFLYRNFLNSDIRLKYKYMKLIDTHAVRDDSELPSADTCALHEGEDDDQFEVKVKNTGRNLLNKFSKLGRRQEKVITLELMKKL